MATFFLRWQLMFYSMLGFWGVFVLYLFVRLENIFTNAKLLLFCAGVQYSELQLELGFSLILNFQMIV